MDNVKRKLKEISTTKPDPFLWKIRKITEPKETIEVTCQRVSKANATPP